jgi:glycosyltransferase involved in cell wall biosynthesis
MTPARSPISRLIAVETHPIQYKAPWFRHLAKDSRIDLTVMYAMLPDSAQQGAGFGVSFEWDQPLLDGYAYEILENRSKHPAVNRFGGCDTPGIHARLRQLSPDAVLVNGWVVKTCLQALVACRRLRVPCIVRGEANNLRPRPVWKRALHRALLSQYRAFLAIGRANHDFYRSHGVPDARVFFAPYCVENDRFAAAAAALAGRRQSLRRAWNIADEACCLLFSGKFEAKKRPLDLIEAAAAARDLPGAANHPLHALFAGDGALRQVCEASCRRLGVPATFTGFLNQAELPSAYAAADALVLPSDAGETWGLVVNEAMASGLPAIVSDRVGCRADLVDHTTGRVFPCGDIRALAACIAGLAADPAARHALGVAAQARVAQYSIEALAKGTLDAVRAVVASDQ